MATYKCNYDPMSIAPIQIHEDHTVEAYYYEGQERQLKEWVDSWIKKGYKETFRGVAENGEQGGVTLRKKIIPKCWEDNKQ